MLDYMKLKVNGSLTPNRKMFYYSGHDSSIIALQRVLGVPWESMVGMVRPASALVIELHQNKTTLQYYLQVYYIKAGKSFIRNYFIRHYQTHITFRNECRKQSLQTIFPEVLTVFVTIILQWFKVTITKLCKLLFSKFKFNYSVYSKTQTY